MVSLVNSHTNATSKRWHMWEIGLRFALSSTPGWVPVRHHVRPPGRPPPCAPVALGRDFWRIGHSCRLSRVRVRAARPRSVVVQQGHRLGRGQSICTLGLWCIPPLSAPPLGPATPLFTLGTCSMRLAPAPLPPLRRPNTRHLPRSVHPRLKCGGSHQEARTPTPRPDGLRRLRDSLALLPQRLLTLVIRRCSRLPRLVRRPSSSVHICGYRGGLVFEFQTLVSLNLMLTLVIWHPLLFPRRRVIRVHTCRCRVQGSGCRVQGSGFRVQGSGFRVQGSGFRVQGSGFRVQGSGFRVQGSGFRVQGAGFRVQGTGRRVQDRGGLVSKAHRLLYHST